MRQDERQGAGATLGDFVATTSWANVAAQSHEAKRSILNFFSTTPYQVQQIICRYRRVADAIAVQWCCDICDHRPSRGTARCDGRGVRQRDFGQPARF